MDYILHIGILISIYSILSVSLNYLAGCTGILSLSHASFFGVGAYSVSLIMIKYDLNFFIALLIGIIITGTIAFLASIPILKLKDDGLILVSLGFGIIAFNIFLNWTSLTNGPLGIKAIPSPEIFGIDFYHKPLFLILCLLFLAITYIFLNKIVSSPYGTVIKGIRENILVVQSSGYNTTNYKYSVFVISAIFAGIAGGLYAVYISYIDPGSFDLLKSIMILVMVILGGMGNLKGSILGAFIVIVFPEILRFVGLPNSIMAEMQQILYGLLLFLLMYLRPQGLIGEYKI